ncbi:MAG: L-2-amino-thiazoline-4-carboxylic acid hydrolase [Pseudomonadota bacterium]
MTLMTSFKIWLMWRGFHRRLGVAGVPVPPYRSFAGRARRYAEQAPMPGSGEGAKVSRAVAALLHAAAEYAEEEGALSRMHAVAAVRPAFLDTGAWLVRAGFAAWLSTVKNPVANLSRRKLDREVQTLWGSGMETDVERHPDELVLSVKSCPFSEYFWNVARPDLTPILCAWDAQWMAQVNTSRSPVQVLRPSTIASGGASCDFRFRRTAMASGQRRFCPPCCSSSRT